MINQSSSSVQKAFKMSRNNCKEKVNENMNMKKSQCFNCEARFNEEKQKGKVCKIVF